jgi:hypothetical protein
VGELLIVMILGLRYFSIILDSFLGAFSRPLSPLRCGFVARAPQELHGGLRGAHFVVFIFSRDRACPVSTKKSFPSAPLLLLALVFFKTSSNFLCYL